MHRMWSGWTRLVSSLLRNCTDAETTRLRRAEMRTVTKVLLFVLAFVITGHVILSELLR